MNEANNDTEIDAHNKELERVHHSSHKSGIITIFLIFGLFGIWSIFAKISTTITAQGKVITKSYNKTVMHPRGGIVKEIYVQEGDSVERDEPLLKLDAATEELEKESNVLQYDSNIFNICRLMAQANIEKKMDCSSLKEKMIQKKNFEYLNEISESTYFSNVKVLEGTIKLLARKNETLHAQNRGLKKQIDSNEDLHMSYQKELKKWNKLLKEDVVDELKAVEIERRIVQTVLEIESLKSKINENNTTIQANKSQINLEKITFENKALLEGKELREKNDLIYNKIKSLEHTIQNAIIKSPGKGLVIDMKIHAKGEVVSPQKPIMSIVPDNRDLMVEAFVLPMDIEKVYKGQKVEVAFPSFVNPSAVPIEGEITYVSADVITPENEKESFYTILIKMTPNGLRAIEKNGFKIIPGMPSSAFVKTGKRTFMEYLMNPLIQLFKGIYHAN